MPIDFWAGWVAVLTIVSLIGFAWVIYGAYFGGKSVEGDEESPTVWDENLREGAHPPPMWWFWAMLASLVFTLIYLILYPGLGSFSGAFKWSQGGELEERLVEHASTFGSRRDEIARMTIASIRQDELLMRAAQRVYDRQCAACHGLDAQGQADMFPNLRDDAWQWGSSPEAIETSIRSGRHGIMVGWRSSLNRAEASQLAQYTLALAKSKPSVHPGKAKFEELCAACHTTAGTGSTALGAPDLTNGVYTYGGGVLEIKETILYGREGIMPAFGDVLDDMQIRLLVAWLTRDV
ncbi:MAG: c-type cytochrome [Gammaproteobacteria bacterium]|nr:c-type cytochrome [Gammaproteobacteria bacterium]